MTARSVSISVALIAGILLLANLLAEEYFVRIDFTEDKQFTLSNATRDILENLEVPVTVKAYFSDELPVELEDGRQQLSELLAEYARYSDDMVIYTFIDPAEDDQIANEALAAGVQQQLVQTTEEDQVSQQVAFFGAVIEVGEEREAIPVVYPNGPLEFQLTSAIKKLSVVDKPAIGLLAGHGEAGMQELQQVLGALEIQYMVEPESLAAGAIPDHVSTLAIVRPEDSIPPADFDQLDAFLARGGNIYLAFDRVSGNFETRMGEERSGDIASWLAGKGLNVQPELAVDVQCGAVTVQKPSPFGIPLPQQVSFPFLPIVNNFADHPAAKGIGNVLMMFPSPMEFTGDTATTKYTPLVRTTARAGALASPQYFNVDKQWGEADFGQSNLAISAALEGPLGGSGNARMVVISDGEFPINQRQAIAPDNVNLVVNAIDWLSDDTGLIDLRARGITNRPLEQLEDSTRKLVKYLNFLLPILLVIGYGVVRFQSRKSQRKKRELENQVYANHSSNATEA